MKIGLRFLLLFLSVANRESFAGDFVFLLGSRGNPYWQVMSEGIQETATRLGVNALIYLQESDAAAETQLNQCQAALARKPKAFIIAAVNESVGLRCLRDAQAAGAVIGEMDSTIQIQVARAGGVTLNFSVGSDNFEIGRAAARHIRSLKPHSRGTVFILEGAAGSLPGKARVDGFREELKSGSSNLTVVASMSANWDRLSAAQMTTDILLRNQQLDFIYAANDLMGLGAAESVKIAKREVQVVSVDGTADARAAVKTGKLQASVAQLPYLVGVRAVELAVEAQKGQMTERREVTDTPVLTKEFLQNPPSSIAPYIR